jgi:probable F420-dependent oxidoreductase
MRFGFYLPNQDPPRAERIQELYDEIFDMVELGDDLGFATCFASEHHSLPDGYIPAPLALCSAVAARTTNIQIATGVMLLPLWHPIRVAEDGALIDIISKGRFALGVGLGLVQREYDLYGIDMKRAPSRMEEAIHVVRSAWTEERFSFEGKHFQLTDATVTPKPVQSPPPIWVGGMSDKSVERAGRLGDGWVTDPLHGFDAIAHWAKIYRDAAAAAGRPAALHLMRDCWVTDGDPYAEWGHVLERDWRFYYDLGFKAGRFNVAAEPWLQELSSSADLTFDKIRAGNRVLVGNVDQVKEQLAFWVEALEPDQVNLRFRFPEGVDHASTKRTMEVFAKEIAPSFATV